MRASAFIRESRVWAGHRQTLRARVSRALIWVLVLVGAAVIVQDRRHSEGLGKKTGLEEAQRAGAFRLDLNGASDIALSQIPGLSPRLAARIVAYRADFGGFRDYDDLLRLPGVGHNRCQRLKPFLVIGPP